MTSSAGQDALLTAALIAGFASLVTLHVATVFGLARRRHFVEAAAAALCPPLGPYRAFVRGMRARAIAWLVVAAGYVTALCLSR